MSATLAAILADKREEVARRRAERSESALLADAEAADPPRGFRAALARQSAAAGLALIAEFKRASPSKGVIRADWNPADAAKIYAEGGAACMSVLTDGPAFQGKADDLVEARAACALPVLRKDFMIDPWQVLEARAMGADAVLVIMAAVDDPTARDLIAEARRTGMDVLIETHDAVEMARASVLGGDLIGINNRDLKSFITDLGVTERLAPQAPPEALIVAESGVAGPSDAHRLRAAGARALLVGELLMRAQEPADLARALIAAGRTG